MRFSRLEARAEIGVFRVGVPSSSAARSRIISWGPESVRGIRWDSSSRRDSGSNINAAVSISYAAVAHTVGLQADEAVVASWLRSSWAAAEACNTSCQCTAAYGKVVASIMAARGTGYSAHCYKTRRREIGSSIATTACRSNTAFLSPWAKRCNTSRSENSRKRERDASRSDAK